MEQENLNELEKINTSFTEKALFEKKCLSKINKEIQIVVQQ